MSTLFYQFPSYAVFVPKRTILDHRESFSDASLRVLDACVAAYRRLGRTVSNKEVGDEIGITSQAVQKQMAFLLTAGKVEATGVHYGLKPIEDSRGRKVEAPNVVLVPILGTVAAGQPIEAVESEPDYRPIPVEWRSGSCYLLRVRGDSMLGDHIRDGDLVLVEETRSVVPDAILVCWLPDIGATIKRVETTEDKTQLLSSNRDFAPIEAPFGTIVQGRVIWVLRSVGPKRRKRT